MIESEYQVIDKTADWSNAKCDKYDYLIAVFCGAIAGLVDSFLVKTPLDPKLRKLSDQATDQLVMKFAKMIGWNPLAENESNVGSAIGFLETKFRVNYDSQHSAAVNNAVKHMTTKNHHLKSLAHAPDIIGLFFSILDQFTNMESFVDAGQLIRIDTSTKKFELQGGNIPAKIFCGFCNWIGHIMSDITGSSGSRGIGTDGRGSGIPMPFYELFLFCDFGSFQVEKDRQTLATVMTRVFQEGYDARFGAAQAVPVLIEELLIRALWVIKNRFYAKKEWDDCIPTKEHADLRIMLIVGNATLCLIDVGDAAIRSGGGANAVTFILHLNLVAWTRLLLLVLRELKIRYGPAIEAAVEKFLGELGFSDKYALKQYYLRLEKEKKEIEDQLRIFVQGVEREYGVFMASVNYIMSPSAGSPEQRMKSSVELAKQYGVPESRIMHSTEELDAWVMAGWQNN